MHGPVEEEVLRRGDLVQGQRVLQERQQIIFDPQLVERFGLHEDGNTGKFGDLVGIGLPGLGFPGLRLYLHERGRRVIHRRFFRGRVVRRCVFRGRVFRWLDGHQDDRIRVD